MIRLPIEQATPCVGHADLFFPPQGEISHAARALSASCYIKEECAEAAWEGGSRVAGVWGGVSEYQRAMARGKRR